MSGSFIEDEALRFEGFNDAQIAQIEAAIPRAQTLVALVEKNIATINEAWADIQALLPVLNMILTTVGTKK
jgi:hypothetical protein